MANIRKGVIVGIKPDNEMPVDKNGVRADIIADSNSTISRMNLGRLYEIYMSGACGTVSNMVRNNLKIDKVGMSETISIIGDLSEDMLTSAYDIVLDFLSMCSPVQYKHFLKHRDNREAKIEILSEICSDTMRLLMKIGDRHDNGDVVEHDEIVTRLENSIYKPLRDKVLLTTPTGMKKYSKNDIRISPIYMVLLEKIADSWLSISSAKTNHFGVLTGIIKADKFKLPWRASPTRTIGETEARLFLSYAGREAIVEMMDRNNNTDSHRDIYRNILEAEKPTDIDVAVNRSKIPYGKTKPMMLIEHMAYCAGFEIVYEKEEK